MVIRFSYDKLYLEKMNDSFNLEIPWTEISYIERNYDNELLISFNNNHILIFLPRIGKSNIERLISENTNYSFK